MPRPAKLAIDAIADRFFQLEEALLMGADLPLKSLLNLTQVLSSLEQQLVTHEASVIRVSNMHKLLAKLIEQEMFLSEHSILMLLAWLSEARSQILSVASFYLEPDWSVTDELHKSVEATCLELIDDGQTAYRGVSNVSLQQSFEDLLSMADIGFWQIEKGQNTAEVDQAVSLCALTIYLDCALSLVELQERFPSWYWSPMTQVGEAPVTMENAAPKEWIEWLHMMASEREVWRSNNTLLALYKAFQRHIKEHHSVSLDLTSDGQNSVLQVAANDQVMAPYDEIAVIGGRALCLLQGQAVGSPLQISNTALPVYRLQFGEQFWVVPAYRAELLEQLPQNIEKGLIFSCGGWKEVMSNEVGDKPILRLEAARQAHWLFPDAIVRDYGTVLQAPYLPRGVLNIWRVRGDFYQEPNFPHAYLADLALPVTCLLNTADTLFSAGWTRLHTSAQSSFYIDNTNLVAVLPVDQLQEVAAGLVFYSGCVIPYIKTNAGSRRDVALIIRQSQSQAVWALQGGSIEVNQALPEVLVDLDVLMLNLHNGTITMAFDTYGEFMLNDTTMPALHKQLLEIF